MFFRAAHVFAPMLGLFYSTHSHALLANSERFARIMTAQNQNWLTTYLRKSGRFPSLYVRERLKHFMECSMRIYMQFIFDCSCIETDTGRPAYSETLSLHKNTVVVLLFYVHGKHLRSCRDGQLT